MYSTVKDKSKCSTWRDTASFWISEKSRFATTYWFVIIGMASGSWSACVEETAWILAPFVDTVFVVRTRMVCSASINTSVAFTDMPGTTIVVSVAMVRWN